MDKENLIFIAEKAIREEGLTLRTIVLFEDIGKAVGMTNEEIMKRLESLSKKFLHDLMHERHSGTGIDF